MTSTEYPLVSILLPVYNAELYIRESIESVLKQTYTNWELVVINDGSIDNSVSIIESFNDKRIRLLQKKNTGMADSLNKGLELAAGEFIARQDADDISLPGRLEKQVDFLRKHGKVSLVGSWSEIIDEKGRSTGRYHKHSTQNAELAMDLLFDNPFVHSSVMFRKNILADCGLYSTGLNSLVQDFEYWFRISRKHEVANIPEVLIKYREIQTSISRTAGDFSAIVAEQSAANILSIVPGEKPEDIMDLAYFYHNAKKLTKVVDKKRLITFENIIRSLQKKVTVSQGTNYSKKYIQALKRRFYSQIIDSEGSSLPLVLFYKIKRRALNAG